MNALYFKNILFNINTVVEIKYIVSSFEVPLLIFKVDEQWILSNLDGLDKRILSILIAAYITCLVFSEYHDSCSICLKT